MRVVFRANGGGAGYGIGHLVRCIALAEALALHNTSVRFICKAHPAGIQLLLKHGYETHPISPELNLEEDLQTTLDLIGDADIIVADSYDFTSQYLAGLHATGKLLISFDDQIDRDLFADIVIGNVYSAREDYASKIKSGTTLLCGPAFVPLRQRFQALPSRHIAEQCNKLLIIFGGEDPANMTQCAVEALNAYPRRLSLEILTGPAYRHQMQLAHALENSLHACRLHSDLSDPLPLFKEVDFAVTAASTTVWELAASGTPMVIFPMIDHQNIIARFAHAQRLGLVITNMTDLCEKLLIIEGRRERQDFSTRCQALIDGKGADRIVNALLDMWKMRRVKLHKTEHDPDGLESKMIWEWRNDPLTRQMSRATSEIAWEQHRIWYEKTIQDSAKVLLLASYDDAPIGVVRFDLLDDNSAEININFNPTARGKRLGQPALLAAERYGFDVLGLERLYAEIKPENHYSIKIFEKAGFVFFEMHNGLRRYLLSYKN